MKYIIRVELAHNNILEKLFFKNSDRDYPISKFLFSNKYFIKYIFSSLVIVLLFSRSAIGQVGIGTITPDTNAVLDLNSASKVLILPRLTTTAINNIPNPTPGMMAYNTTLGKFVGYAPSTSTSVAIQQTSGNFVTTASSSSLTQVSQTFTPIAPFPFLLNYVTAYIFTNAGGPTAAATMTIIEGLPGGNGPVIGTASLTFGTSTTNVPGTATFSNIQLSPGQTYTIKISFNTPNVGMIVYTGDMDPYAGGDYYQGTIQFPARDLKMTIGRLGFAWAPLN